MKKGINYNCVKKEEHVRHMCWYIPEHSTLKNIVIALSGQSTLRYEGSFVNLTTHN